MTGASHEFEKKPLSLPQEKPKAEHTDKFYKEIFWPPYENNDTGEDILFGEFKKEFDSGDSHTKFHEEIDFDQPSKTLKNENKQPETNKRTTVNNKFKKETEPEETQDKPDSDANSEARETETTNKGKFDKETDGE